MSKLTKLLEFERAGNVEKKKIQNTNAFKTLVLDTLNKPNKELLLSDAANATELLQESVYDTIIAGAEPVRCMRDVIPVIPIGDHQMRVTYASGAAAYASVVAEGATIPINVDKFNTVTITPYKIGVRPIITNEMIEDELWDMVEWHLNWAGRAIENKLNRDVLDAFIVGSAHTAETGVGAFDTMAECRATVEQYGWLPNKLVICPTMEKDLLKEDHFANASYYGNGTAVQTGRIPNVLGFDIHRLSVINGTTYTWDSGFDGADEYGALMLDSRAPYMMIGMKRDISVEEYDDPIHDLAGIAATMRFNTGIIQDRAGIAWKHS